MRMLNYNFSLQAVASRKLLWMWQYVFIFNKSIHKTQLKWYLSSINRFEVKTGCVESNLIDEDNFLNIFGIIRNEKSVVEFLFVFFTLKIHQLDFNCWKVFVEFKYKKQKLESALLHVHQDKMFSVLSRVHIKRFQQLFVKFS